MSEDVWGGASFLSAIGTGLAPNPIWYQIILAGYSTLCDLCLALEAYWLRTAKHPRAVAKDVRADNLKSGYHEQTLKNLNDVSQFHSILGT